MSSSSSRHVPGIDTWRGLSVLLVITHHVAIRLPLSEAAGVGWLPDRVVRAICWNGHEAVNLFFVISGFLITTHTLHRHGRPADVSLRAFWTRRVARIAPPLLLLVAVLSALHLMGVPHHTIDTERQSLGAAIASALTFWLHVYEARTGYLPGGWDVLWSLSIEELFYLAFPLVLLLGRTEGRVAALLAPLAFGLPVWHALAPQGIARDKATLPGMAAIAIGVLVALAARRLPDDRSTGWVLTVFGSGAIVSVLLWGDLWWTAVSHGTLWVHIGGAGLAVLGAWMLRGETPLAVLEPLRVLGRLSYEVYLTHMFAVFAVVELWRVLRLTKAEGALAYPLVVSLSAGLGFVFAKGWSEPANRTHRARLLGGVLTARSPR